MITQHLDRSAWIFLGIIALIGIAVPIMNLAFEPGSTFYVPGYAVGLIGKYLTYALLALSVDLIWGYCGILSLGHGAFFALGGYAMGMYLMRQIGDRGVYANPDLPDFMVFLNWQELPWYWYGFDFFPFAMLMVIAVPGALAFVFGWLAFRSRVTGVYFSIITQAMTYALLLAFFRNDMGFGGNNGLTDFKDILGFDIQAAETRAALLIASAAALALGFVICRVITGSKLGNVLLAIRDAESRTRFLGYRVEHYKLFVFVLSAMMAGVAGALYVPQVGIINPGEFSPANSIEIVVWVAVGGRGPDRCRPRRRAGQLRQDLLHRRLPRDLALRPGRPLHRHHPLPPQGHPGHPPNLDLTIAPQKGKRKPGRQSDGKSSGAAWRMIQASPTHEEIARARPILYLNGVSVSFDGFKALNALSFYVEPGEMRAIIGPNGAGKTTMMDVITGKTRPDEGDVLFEGDIDLTKRDEATIAGLGIGRKFQKPTVFENQSVIDNLMLALPERRTPWAALFGGGERQDRLDEVLDTIGLAERRQDEAGALSHGQKQWLEIGMLLCQDPKLLLVDEPVAGMTDAETEQTSSLLRRIAEDHSVVVVEHDMTFVRDLDVKVTVLHEGAVLAEGSLDQVSADQRVIDVYLGR